MSEVFTKNLNASPKSKEHEIDIKEFLFKLLMHWRWFLLSIILCIAYGALKIYRSTPLYSTQELVMIKDSRSSGNNEFLLELSGMGRTNMENEIAMLSSPDICAKVVTALELYTTYRIQGQFGMREREMYGDDCPLYVRLENVAPDSIYSVYLEITPLKDRFEISVGGRVYSVRTSDMPIQLETTSGLFYIDFKNGFPMPERMITVSVNNPKAISWMYAGSLTINESGDNSTLLNISIVGQHPVKCKDFIMKLIDIYNDETTNDKNTVSRNTSIFIDARIKEISKELGEVEETVEDFQKTHQITDLSSAANAYFQRSNANEQELSKLETQLNLIKFVENFILNSDNSNKLIPNISLSDVGISNLIARYNEEVLSRERLVKATSDANPALIQLNENIAAMKQGIVTAISNVKRTTQISKENLEQENVINSARVRTVPQLDRQLSEIFRQQKVKEDLYIYLLKIREETSLQQAAISPKAKIITEPVASFAPIAPNAQTIMMYSLIAGLLIPLLLVVIRDFFRVKIGSLEDLTKMLEAPYIGEISKNSDSNSVVVVKKNANTSIVELFRALRNNINFIIASSNKKVILVTSTLSGEGKTFVSINLAMSFALMDKKVLLAGLDIRNPKLSQNLGLKKNLGATSYLSGSENDFHKLIHQSTFSENLDIMQAGSIPPNPNELLVSERLDMMIEALRNEYDIIIIDTAPVGLVSDTFLLNRIADMFIYVTRENVTPKPTVEYINSIYNEQKLNNMYVILNATVLDKKKYGYSRYKYGYKYYYGYYSDKGNKSGRKFLRKRKNKPE